MHGYKKQKTDWKKKKGNQNCRWNDNDDWDEKKSNHKKNNVSWKDNEDFDDDDYNERDRK